VIAINSQQQQSTHDAAALKSQWSPQYGLYSVQIFDPFKDKQGGMRPVTAQAFSEQAAFITSHNISREILLQALNTPPGTPLKPGQLAVKSKAYVARERRTVAIQKANGGAKQSKSTGPDKKKNKPSPANAS
jgi:hypothetical protein